MQLVGCIREVEPGRLQAVLLGTGISMQQPLVGLEQRTCCGWRWWERRKLRSPEARLTSAAHAAFSSAITCLLVPTEEPSLKQSKADKPCQVLHSGMRAWVTVQRMATTLT